jgi:hypothetical protein
MTADDIQDRLRRFVEARGPAMLVALAMACACLVALLPTPVAKPIAAAADAHPVQGSGLSETRLRLIQARMGPGGQLIVRRLFKRGRQIDPYRPAGWAMFDLGTIPTLGFRGLSDEDARAINAAVPDSQLPVESGRPFILTDMKSASGQRALQCLAQAIYFETGRDDERAQSAVAQVVLNRVRHPAYPHSVCGVVYQGAMLPTGCQFSFTCDGSLKRGLMQSAFARAQAVARRALLGFVFREVGVSTNYHADYVAPYWAATMVKIGQVGPHIFYRWTGPLGQRAALNQRYIGNETTIAASVLASWDSRTQGVDAAVALNDKSGSGTRVSKTAVATLQAAGLVAKVQDGRVHAFLNPMARKPTPDEVKAINGKLADFEKGLEPKVDPVTAPAAAPTP